MALGSVKKGSASVNIRGVTGGVYGAVTSDRSIERSLWVIFRRSRRSFQTPRTPPELTVMPHRVMRGVIQAVVEDGLLNVGRQSIRIRALAARYSVQ